MTDTKNQNYDKTNKNRNYFAVLEDAMTMDEQYEKMQMVRRNQSVFRNAF